MGLQALPLHQFQYHGTGYDPGQVPKGFGVKQAVRSSNAPRSQALRSFKFMK